MTKVQFLKTDAGEIAIMPRAEYDRLAALTRSEDAGTRRLVRTARDKIARGSEILVPKEVADRIANGENPIRVLRAWRGLTQAELALKSGMTQGYLSDIENGRRRGIATRLVQVARALRVPLELIVP